MDVLSIFKDIAIIVIFAKAFGLLARKLKAPQVVGEIIAGLLIGPSVLGIVKLNDFLSICAADVLGRLGNRPKGADENRTKGSRNRLRRRSRTACRRNTAVYGNLRLCAVGLGKILHRLVHRRNYDRDERQHYR